ncbi:MAG: tetratricopeptide repeat protein [Verrucomicrobiales bacterium]|jgi:tetratricopeptide (TPR) repeat protein|nr:tetratricopeptide repeat protein [Verrucomicrobiales bacterium]
MKNLKSKLRQGGLILALLLLASAPLMAGKPGTSDFDAANQAYAAKKYDDAIRIYENLLQDGSLSASVFYNLGNAYYLKGEIGKAVLEYQRALLLEPNAADVAANLAVLRQSRGLPEPVVPVWQKPFVAFGLNTWAWIGFASLLAAMLGVFLRGAWLNFGEHEKCPTRLFHGMVAVSVLVLLLAGGGMMVQTQQLDQQVVMGEGTPLKVSPFADAGDVASLKEGDLVKPLKHYNEFVYVKNPAGQKGWIPLAKLKPVLPAS